MAVCAILNIGVLLTNTLNMMLSQGYHIHLRSQFDFGWCRINAFIAQWIRGMASWILVIVACDRFQQSKQVHRPLVRKNHRVLTIMLITGLILFILNLHYLLFTGNKVLLAENTTFLACIFDKYSDNQVQKFFASTSTWQELVTYTIIVRKHSSFPSSSSSVYPILAVRSHAHSQRFHYQKFFSQSDQQ